MDVVRDELADDPTVDITTIGRTSGQPRRVEIWMLDVGGRFFITGTPGPRDWLANLLADPTLIVHLKRRAGIDLAARAQPVADPMDRRRVLEDASARWYRSQAPVDELVAAAPLIEVTFQPSPDPPTDQTQGEPMAEPTQRVDLNPPHQHADGRSLTDEEQRNVAAMERFRDLYNGEEMERFVGEAYAASFHVLNLDGSSWTAGGANRQNLLSDPKTFVRAEAFIKAKAPGRRMVYRRVIPSGNVVTLEASIVDDSRPGWELSWCAIYTFDTESRIISDHTYLNRKDWPGISELLGDRT